MLVRLRSFRDSAPPYSPDSPVPGYMDNFGVNRYSKKKEKFFLLVIYMKGEGKTGFMGSGVSNFLLRSNDIMAIVYEPRD